MRIHLAFLAAACALLASCGGDRKERDDERAPSPILYELASADGGELEGWLFGTIHALPDGTKWRTEKLQSAVDDADYLIVEIAELDNQRVMVDTFMSLSRTPDQPDIATRVAQDQRPLLFSLIERTGYSPHDFASVETWAAALMLAQGTTTGDPANGVDRALLKDFQGRDVHEFEGARLQLSIFDTLPEKEQRDLLEGVVAESQAEDPAKLRKAWLAGDEGVLIEATNTGIMADPELRAAILTGRNDAWLTQLLPLLERPEKPFVAVGAAHLVGPDGLAAQLAARGFAINRIQ